MSFTTFTTTTPPENTRTSMYLGSVLNPADLSTLENLVFWCLGYGGWAGMGLLPLAFTLTKDTKVRVFLTILMPPVVALLMTAAFGIGYMTLSFASLVFRVMMSPLFLHPLCRSIVLFAITLSASSTICEIIDRKFHCINSEFHDETTASDEVDSDEEDEDVSDGDEEDEDVSDGDEEDENVSDGDEEDENVSDGDEEDEGEEACENASDEDENIPYNRLGKPDDVDLTILRDAPPLPESDAELETSEGNENA